MSYRIWRPSPRTSTGMKMRMALRGPWSPALGDSPDEQFLRSWLESDSDTVHEEVGGRINWGVVSGLALALGVSATFWAGVGWVLSRI
jgi:hypothetical protein